MQMTPFKTGRKHDINIVTFPSEGVSDTAIFCIHGMGGRAEQFYSMARHLQPFGKVIIPEMLGHGHSPKPHRSRRYNANRFLEDLTHVFDHYAMEKNILIGHSLGGAMAAHLAILQGKNVQKLILFSPMAHKPFKNIPLLIHCPVWFINIFREWIENDFFSKTYPETSDPQALAIESEASRRNPMYVIKPLVLSLAKIKTIDPSEIKASTLIIAGGKDKLIPLEEIKTFYGSIPKVHIEELPALGHYTYIEKPYLCQAIVQKFLQNRIDQEGF